MKYTYLREFKFSSGSFKNIYTRKYFFGDLCNFYCCPVVTKTDDDQFSDV